MMEIGSMASARGRLAFKSARGSGSHSHSLCQSLPLLLFPLLLIPRRSSTSGCSSPSRDYSSPFPLTNPPRPRSRPWLPHYQLPPSPSSARPLPSARSQTRALFTTITSSPVPPDSHTRVLSSLPSPAPTSQMRTATPRTTCLGSARPSSPASLVS